METSPLRVALTGPESTGKTSLAGELARAYDTAWSPEFAREYAESKDGPLDASDVEPIGRGQLRNEDDAAARARRLVILDTDLVSTVLYARHYYGPCPEWIERAARERLADLYLFADADAPFEPDEVRDSAATRDALHREFESELARLGAQVVRLVGPLDTRFAQAMAAIDAVLDVR